LFFRKKTKVYNLQNLLDIAIYNINMWFFGMNLDNQHERNQPKINSNPLKRNKQIIA
jgi:hypothetical protein